MPGREHVRAVVVHDDQVLLMKRNKFGDQFYTFVGGGIEAGEDHLAALVREVSEETSLVVRPQRLIWQSINEQHHSHYAYLCDYVSGQPALDPESEEYADNLAGKNLYEPLWVPVQDVVRLHIKPEAAKWELLDDLAYGWPVQPKTLHL